MDLSVSNGVALIQSKTFWGALLALVAVVAQQFGIASALAWASDPNTVTSILNWVSIAGTAFAIFGRVTAIGKIVSIFPAK